MDDVKVIVQRSDLVTIANTVRKKTGKSEELTLTEINADIDSIGGSEQATPEISINSSTGLITATAGTKTATKQLAFQPAKTITPSTASQIAVSSGYYTGGNITVAGDSNLVASNIKSGTSIFGVNGTYEGSGGSSSGDGYEEADSLVTRTVSSYTNDRVTTIGSGAFFFCSQLTTVGFPVATSIGSYAFQGCSKLTTVSFPSVTTIGNSAFYNCPKLTTVSFPVTTSIGSGAFDYCINLTTASFPVATTIGNVAFDFCPNLTTVSFPEVTTIGGGAFSGCRSLTTISFPVATSIGSNAFQGCSKLTTVSFPSVTTIGGYAFQGCLNLTTVSFPVTTSIGSYAFQGCINLTTASFPVATTIGNSAFQRCYNLKSLYLTNSVVCTLSNSNAFTSTPIGGYSTSAGTYGSIYVPASLVDAYKSATNWTYFSSRFVGIS